MNCEKCGKPATVHLTNVVSGRPTDVHLCQACSEGEVKVPHEVTQFRRKSAETREAGHTLKDSVGALKNAIDRNRFRITSTAHFIASHQLRLYDGSLEELHEHDWQVRFTVSGPLDSIGVVMDFHDLEKRIEAVLNPMRGRSLNDLAAFAADNPSAENVAMHIGSTVALPETVKLVQVEVWETPENSAIYMPPFRR